VSKVLVRQLSKPRNFHNPISGHRWTVHEPIKKFEVVGPFGVCSTHTDESKAEQSREEWQAFYDKFFPAE